MKRHFIKHPVTASNHPYLPPRGPEPEDMSFVAQSVARRLKARHLDEVTIDQVIEAFVEMNDDYADYWARALRTPEQEKEFVDQLLAELANYGITDVIDDIYSATDVVTSSDRITSQYSFDFIWGDDYDMDEIESAIYRVFEMDFNLEVTGIDFRSPDYEDIKEYHGQNITQCGVDFLHEGDYPDHEIAQAMEDELRSLGYELIGTEFSGLY